jgi:hypothetical protein
VEKNSFVLAFVETKPLLQASALALGCFQESGLPSVPQAHLEALDWQSLGCQAQLLEAVAKE